MIVRINESLKLKKLWTKRDKVVAIKISEINKTKKILLTNLIIMKSTKESMQVGGSQIKPSQANYL